MEKRFDNIEKSIQSAFNKHEIPVDATDWDLISKTLGNVLDAPENNLDTFESQIKSTFSGADSEVGQEDWEAIAAKMPASIETPLESSFKKAFTGFNIPVNHKDWRAIFLRLPFGQTGLSRFTVIITGLAILALSFLSFAGVQWFGKDDASKKETTNAMVAKGKTKPESSKQFLELDNTKAGKTEKNSIDKGNPSTDGTPKDLFKGAIGKGSNTASQTEPVALKTEATNTSALHSNGTEEPTKSKIPHNPALNDILRSLDNAKNLEDLNNYISNNSAYSNAELEQIPSDFLLHPISGISLNTIPLAGHPSLASLDLDNIKKYEFADPRFLNPYASLGFAYSLGAVNMSTDVNRNVNFFNRDKGTNRSIQLVAQAGVSANLGKGFSIYSGVSAENNLNATGSRDTIRIKVPTAYFFYRGSMGELIYQKARQWKDSFLISSSNPSANYLDIPLGVSKAFSVNGKWSVVLGLNGSFGLLTSAGGDVPNPYAYDHPTFWREIEGINASGEYLVNSKTLLNKTRINAGASIGIEKKGLFQSHGLKLSINQSLQNQFNSSAGLVYLPTRFGVEYTMRFKLFKVK